jgi:hypothetical protein
LFYHTTLTLVATAAPPSVLPATSEIRFSFPLQHRYSKLFRFNHLAWGSQAKGLEHSAEALISIPNAIGVEPAISFGRHYEA